MPPAPSPDHFAVAERHDQDQEAKPRKVPSDADPKQLEPVRRIKPQVAIVDRHGNREKVTMFPLCTSYLLSLFLPPAPAPNLTTYTLYDQIRVPSLKFPQSPSVLPWFLLPSNP